MLQPNYSNPTIALYNFLQLLKVPATLKGVDTHLQQHPNYPSLLSITDTLTIYKVEHATYEIENDKLSQLPLPFFTSYKSNGGNFVVVTNITNDIVTYIENEATINQPIATFINNYNNIVVLAEANEKSSEPNFKHYKKAEFWQQIQLPFFVGLALLLMGVSGFVFQIAGLHFYLISLLKVAGIVVSCLLLWFEIDKNNKTLQKICTGAKNVNCGAILGSKAAKLFNFISWSEVGFLYFSTTFLLLILVGQQAIAWVGLFSFLVVPYTIFSIYYQLRVAKQWCLLCLWVQAILLLESAITLYNGFAQNSVSINNMPWHLVALAVLLPMCWFVAKPLFVAKIVLKQYTQVFNRTRYNPLVFYSLLKKQKHIAINSTQGLGITIGNANATNTIVKVCNPYCGPCAKAHEKLEHLLKEFTNLNIQILFNATLNEWDNRTEPVAILLAIQKHNPTQIHKALDDWYLAPKKDIAVFKEKYKVTKVQVEEQYEGIQKMYDWCNKNTITFTPTIFLNNYQLPEAYSIESLLHFIDNEEV
jgi:thiol-disulfide isomerase/thioredoxin